MNTPRFRKLIPMLLAACVAGAAYAKLPPAPPVDPAVAEAAKLKAAEASKKEAEALGKAQDRVVERYKKEKGMKTAAPAAAAAPAKK